jgi:hypothetical protein
MKTVTNTQKYFLLLITLGIINFYSCTEDFSDNPIGNSPPNTGLFLFPDSSVAQQPSRLRVSWWGDDPDGTIIGYYIKWEGIDNKWSFTTSNDSTFSLPIGTRDTTFNFLVSAIDAQGNNKYDNQVFQNGIDFGAEPFIDKNKNGVFDNGEFFYDLGLIDPTPASTLFPIKNTPPILNWDELSFLPDTSFPVITIRWNASDLDGDESITSIKLAINDTANFVALNGSVRLVTLRGVNLDSANPEMEILINGDPQNVNNIRLQGLKLDDNNILYLKAEDLSGSTSNILNLPETSTTWFVKKPKGQVLIFDDYKNSSTDLQASQFYNQVFSTIRGGSLAGKFEVFDLVKNQLAFESVTILETLKLFKYIFWYSASNPRLDLLNISTEKFKQSGGKIAFSMTFQDSSANFSFDLSSVQGFLPIDNVSKVLSSGFLLLGANATPSAQNDFPPLKTSVTISFVRSFTPNNIVTEKIYELFDRNNVSLGNIGFRTTSKDLFFIGLPLHQSNANSGSVDTLLEKIFFEDFGVIP